MELRWGSLYDAFYGTDVIDEAEGRERTAGYNPVRGQAVVARPRQFLDESAPLPLGSHADATAYRIEAGALVAETADGATGLADPGRFTGFRGDGRGARRHAITAIAAAVPSETSSPSFAVGLSFMGVRLTQEKANAYGRVAQAIAAQTARPALRLSGANLRAG